MFRVDCLFPFNRRLRVQSFISQKKKESMDLFKAPAAAAYMANINTAFTQGNIAHITSVDWSGSRTAT